MHAWLYSLVSLHLVRQKTLRLLMGSQMISFLRLSHQWGQSSLWWGLYGHGHLIITPSKLSMEYCYWVKFFSILRYFLLTKTCILTLCGSGFLLSVKVVCLRCFQTASKESLEVGQLLCMAFSVPLLHYARSLCFTYMHGSWFRLNNLVIKSPTTGSI